MSGISALIDQMKPYTALSRDGLVKLYQQCQGLALPAGAVVQCGVVNGGSAGVLWNACGGSRHLWMFDSWEGLPEPGPKDGGKAAAKWAYQMEVVGSWCKGDKDLAYGAARMAGVPEEQIHCVKGWFKDTLPVWAEKIGPIAMLHLDADWYQSTIECLTYLYPLLAPDGLLVLDDYGYWKGCDQACREYGIDELLTPTPPCGAWLVKGSN